MKNMLYLAGKGLYLIAFCPDELKNIRIFLMRHDARTGSKFIGKLKQSEILAGIKANITGHLRQGGCQGGKAK